MNTESLITKKILDKLADKTNTNSDDWYLVSRARHSLELTFRAISKLNPDSNVITQPFTCVTAVNPILAAGLNPIYCDINKSNLSMDAELLNRLIDSYTSAVVAQHTLGMQCDVEKIYKLKKTFKFVLIEDSAHCLGTVNQIADVSIHSFGAEKILNTSFGSAIWINPKFKNTQIGIKLLDSLHSMKRMTLFEKLTYGAYPYFNRILNRTPIKLSLFLRKCFSKLHIYIAPVMPIELHGKNYRTPKKLSLLLLKRIYKEILSLESNLNTRKKSLNIYNELTSNFSIDLSSSPVRFPYLADSAEEAENIFYTLRNKGFTIGKWYRPLLFPGTSDKVYNYINGSCTLAEECSRLIVNLPTNVNESTAKEIVNEIKNIGTERRR